MTFLIYTLLNASGQPEKSALLADDAPGLGQYLAAMHPDTRRIISGSYRHKTRDEISSSGYVLSSLEAALWCFWHSGTFAEGALLAANLGDDADTVAAIYGQLAGAWYGYPALPESWLARLAWKDEISHRALLLLARQDNAALHAFIRDCRAVEDLSRTFGPYSERHGLMMPGLNWPDWIAARRSLPEPAQIAQASVAECLSLITAINRGERFNEGLLVSCAQNGVLQAIVDRLAALSGYAE